MFVVIGILFTQETGQFIFELIFAGFMAFMFICFSMNFIYSNPPIAKIANGFIPSVPSSLSFTAVIGAIIMPQNMFLHSSLVQTRKLHDFSKKIKIRMFVIETIVLLVVSFLMNFCIVTLFADPRYNNANIRLENVGTYLVEFLPKVSQTFWGLGLLASGISSTAGGALTGQYLMNGIFNFQFSKIKRIIITR